jgi:butyryl-CoA dehydrogenase
MDFSLNDEQQMFRDLFRDFAANEVAPLAEHGDKSEEPPLALLKKAGQQGFLGATIPEAYGGAGMDYLTYCLLVEAIAEKCLATSVAIGIHTMLSAMTLLDGGSEAQKQAFLPRLAGAAGGQRGGELGTFALTEPEAGSDAGGVQARAEREDGHYRLNGVKSGSRMAGWPGCTW